MKLQLHQLILVALFAIISSTVFAQDVTKIRGKVTDAKTGESLPFVDVGLLGTNVGVSTDLDGYYNIETRFASDTVFASFLGYETQYFPIIKGKKNNIDFLLQSESLQIETVEIKEKKTKYSKKNNPALELAKKVINNKYVNSLKGKDYYTYDQHEKLNLDVNNITEDFKNTRFIKKFDFMWDYIDTSEINGKTFLPLFLRETLSTVYYKKDGDVLKEVRKASRYTETEESLDAGTINDVIDALYQDVDIYEEKIDLLDQQFVSPFAKAGDDFYRYYIIDTTEVNGKEAINLAFIPAVKGNFGFIGNIFISNDGKYTVMKVDMGIVEGINLNFVRDIQISQEFEPLGESYIKTKDQVVIDYSLTQNGWGLYGGRTLYYTNYSFEKPEDESVFSNIDKVIYTDDAYEKSDEYWTDTRIKPLEEKDVELYEMLDSLQQNKYYQRYTYVLNTGITGYAKVGPVGFGPIATFMNFNAVEGINVRFGGATNMDFYNKWKIRGYLGRATKTKKWTYSTSLLYSFNSKFYDNPRHFVQIAAERASSFPGQELELYSPENFFLSFQRGDATRMLLTNTYEAKYVHEVQGFSYHLDLRYKKRLPYGNLEFYTKDIEGNKIFRDDVTTNEVTVGVRYAPNEQFLQGKDYRTQLYNEYPIITLNYTQGIENTALGGDFNFSKLDLNVFKQIEWLTLGTTNLVFDAGKTWGDVPYILQNIPRGNQTYAYQLTSYNMMNFMEFVTDQFVSINAEHYFYGYLFNRLPLIKKLKLREILTFKAFYGSLSDEHNPNLNPELYQFPLGADGNTSTFLMGKEPYMELSLGFTNILKVLRIDVVQRLNYLDQPNVPALFGNKGLGVRIRTHVEF